MYQRPLRRSEKQERLYQSDTTWRHEHAEGEFAAPREIADFVLGHSGKEIELFQCSPSIHSFFGVIVIFSSGSIGAAVSAATGPSSCLKQPRRGIQGFCQYFYTGIMRPHCLFCNIQPCFGSLWNVSPSFIERHPRRWTISFFGSRWVRSFSASAQDLA